MGYHYLSGIATVIQPTKMVYLTNKQGGIVQWGHNGTFWLSCGVLESQCH